MANLGTLWFGADIDLNALRQKIQSGNQSILNALKMDYDPASYQQMISKLRSQLDKETFEIKLTANTKGLFGQGTGANSRNPFNFGDLPQKIKAQQDIVDGLRAKVAKLRAEYQALGKGYSDQLRASAIKQELKTTLTQLANENLTLKQLKSTRTAYNQTIADTNRAQKQAARDAKQMGDSQIKLNTTLWNGVHISTQLGSALTSVFAIDAARQFLNNVIEIGGQLEKQRISMGAILGDVARANQLFDQIKGLAVKSPFGVVELDQYSKQLAAFGIEQSDLFNMTKRLADISAGAGQDIGRLALALGHVKSATYLTGITLRQFSMNNIPMLKMLAEYYSEVEKRAVSTAEVQKRISKRQVSYEDVLEQIKRMTDEGGMFYNMQEKISESVAAKWKNLRDSLDIMYGEIAESKVGNMLKETAEALMVLTKNWKSIITILAGAGATFGIIRVSTLAINTALIAQQRVLTAQKLGWNANAMAASKYSVAQLRVIATMNTFHTKSRLLNRALLSLSLTWKGLVVSAKAMGAALLAAMPQIALFAGVSALFGMWQKNNEEMEKAVDLSKQLFDRTQEGLKNIKQMMSDTGMIFRDQYGNESNLFGKVPGEIIVPNVKSVDSATMAKNIDVWEDFIRNYASTPNLMLQAAYATDENGKAVHSLAEQYTILGEKAKIVAESIPLMSKFGEYLSESIEESDGGWFDDNLLTDLKDYENSVKKYKRYAQDLYREHKKEVVAAVDAARANAEFGKALEEVGIRSDDYASQLYKLATESSKFGDAAKKASDSWRDSVGGSIFSTSIFQTGALASAEREMEDEFNQVITRLKAKMESSGINPAKLSEPERLALTQAFTDMATKAGLSIDEVTKKVMELVTREFPDIKVDIDEVKTLAKVSAIKEDLDKLVNGTFLINIDTTTNAFDVIQKIREGYKTAKDQIENAEPILLKLKTTADAVALMDDQTIERLSKGDEFTKQVLEGIRKAQQTVNQALKVSNEKGFSLTDPTKGGKVFRDKSGKDSDKWLKDMKERLKELENFYNVYKRYADYMSNDDAIQKALDSDVFKGKDLPKNIDDYLSVLKDFRKKVEAEMGKNPSTERKSFLTELLTKIDEKEFEVKTKEATEALLKQLEEQLKRQGKQWDLYKKILDATGDKSQAATIAFGSNIQFDNFAEQLRSEIAKALKDNKKAADVSIDELLGMDENKLKKDYDIFGELARKLKELKDVEQQLKAEEVELFLDAIKNAKSLETELSQIDLKYERARDAIKKEGGSQSLIDNTYKNQNSEKAKARWEWFKNTNEDWGRIFADLDNISTRTLQSMLDKLRNIAPSIKDSTEGTKALYEAMDKIQEKLYDRNPFSVIFGAVQQGTRLRQLYKAMNGRDFTPNAKSAKYYGLQEGKVYKSSEILDLIKNAGSDLVGGLEGLAAGFKAVEDALTPVIDLFNILGHESLSNFFQMGSNALGAASQTAQGLKSLGLENMGPYGAAAAAALSLVSSAFALHDEALQEEIEASKHRQKEMENLTKNLETALERTLGGVYTTKAGKEIIDAFEKEITNPLYGSKNWVMYSEEERGSKYRTYLEEDTLKAVKNAEKTKTYYDAAYASMLAQRDELKHQMASEEDKKDSDSSKISDYKQEIMEMEDEIEHFAEDMAKALYDIDVKSWAQELGDALFEAWQKGEDGAEAFKKKASELMADLAKNIAVTKLIETAMAPVLKIITSEMERTSGKLDEGSINAISEQMAVVGGTLPDAFNNLMDGLNEGIKKAGLTDMKELAEDSSSSSASATIKGITEQTADLLASYVNGIRADVSVIRAEQSIHLPAISSSLLRVSVLAETQVTHLAQIAANTSRNADAADRIYNLLHSVAPDGTRIQVK